MCKLRQLLYSPGGVLKCKFRGQGIEQVWTQRALERLGFGIGQDNEEAAFSLKVNKNLWEVERFGLNQNFEDIESLIEWIRSVDWRG